MNRVRPTLLSATLARAVGLVRPGLAPPLVAASAVVPAPAGSLCRLIGSAGRLALITLVGLAVLGSATSVQAQTAGKRLIRIHTAGPNDLGVDNTFLAQEFADYVNANAPSLEVKVFANSQLGQSREVIEAMRLGSGAARIETQAKLFRARFLHLGELP